MPGKILGIDISENNISAVQAISGLKGYQVVSCFSTPITDGNIGKALEELSDNFDLKNDKCLLTIPTSNTSFRNVNTPFKDSKKIRQTLPFEIETLVPFVIDKRIIDYIHTDRSDPASVLTAATDRNFIEDYLEQLKGAGVEPDIIDIRPVPAVTWLLDQERTPDNGIYLDLEPEHPCVVIFKNKKIVLIRELPCSFTENAEKTDPEENERYLSEPIGNIINTICRETDRTVYSFSSKMKNGFTIEKVFFGGRLSTHSNTSEILNSYFKTPAERINISKDIRLKMDAGLSGIYKPALMDNALAVSIRESKKSAGFNFRRGEFAVKRKFLGPGKDIRRVALLLGILLVMIFINSGMDYYYLSKKHTQVEETFNKKFNKALPDEKGVKGSGHRKLILKQKLKELKNPSSGLSDRINPDQKVLDILQEIIKRVDGKYDMDISTLTIRDNDVTISATTDNYSTVAEIVNALKRSALFTRVETDGKIERKNERVKFNLKLGKAD